jgi:hypothetical protein
MALSVMFNLLVSANDTAWEGRQASMDVSRFKEYSGSEADAISLRQPETLRRLEDVPALLMYELGVVGPNSRLVRHGRMSNINRNGNELTFNFELDPDRGYLSRGAILEFADLLGMHRFEQHRTHWAVKDGSLPIGLLAKAVALPPERNIAVVAAEYAQALTAQDGPRIGELRQELREFPASAEKAVAIIRSRAAGGRVPEVYPLLGVRPKTAEGRAAVEAVLIHSRAGEMSAAWPFSLVWFLDLFGGPTEANDRAAAVRTCTEQIMRFNRCGRLRS